MYYKYMHKKTKKIYQSIISDLKIHKTQNIT